MTGPFVAGRLETGAFVGSFATSGVPLRSACPSTHSGKNISVLDRAGHVTSFSTGAGETIELEITDLTEFDPTSDSKQISPIGRVFEPGAIALRGESEPSGLAVWRGSLFRFEARTATFEGPPFVHRKPMQASSEERLLTLVNASNGLIDDSFAYVCNLDFSELTFVNEHLARLGMQPRKCRPFESHEGLRVAAIWRRDNDKAELRRAQPKRVEQSNGRVKQSSGGRSELPGRRGSHPVRLDFTRIKRTRGKSHRRHRC